MTSIALRKLKPMNKPKRPPVLAEKETKIIFIGFNKNLTVGKKKKKKNIHTFCFYL